MPAETPRRYRPRTRGENVIPAHPDGFRGIYPATLCPFTRDDAVDEAALARHVADLADVTGIVGVLCNGHAGENYLLSNCEIRRVAERVSAEIGDRAIVVSGVNREGSRDARRARRRGRGGRRRRGDGLSAQRLGAGAGRDRGPEPPPPHPGSGGRADHALPGAGRGRKLRLPAGRPSRSSCVFPRWSPSRKEAGRSLPTNPIGGSSRRWPPTWPSWRPATSICSRATWSGAREAW